MKKIRTWIKRISVFLLFLISFMVLPLSFPDALFAYSLTKNSVSIHSDTPIPAKEANALLERIESKLVKFRIDELQPMQIYIANTNWIRSWLWLSHLGRDIGGFVRRPITKNHTFLSGADFNSNELIAPSGYRPQPPRTLEFYGIHELTHVVTANRVGSLYFSFIMPKWIREGLADYVAMPPESASELFSKIGKNDADLAMIKAHGAYPSYRLLVAYFLEDKGWALDKLLSSRLTLDDAREIAFAGLDMSD